MRWAIIGRNTYQKIRADIVSLKANSPEDSIFDIAAKILNRVKSRNAVSDPSKNSPLSKKVEWLTYALISDYDQDAARYIQDVREDSASLDSVYLSHLAGAAYLLGDWWTNDHVSFVEVTVGTSRIYAIMQSAWFQANHG